MAVLRYERLKKSILIKLVIMQIGDKIFTIKNRKIVEYKVTQVVTTLTAKGEDVEIFVQNNGVNLDVKKMSIKDLKDYFMSKEEANMVLDIIKKYI